MLIFPKRIAKAAPTITFYFEQNRISLSSAATKKISAKHGDRIAFDVDDTMIKLVFHHDGFFLSKKTGSNQMFYINSSQLCEFIREKFASENEKTISYLVGTRENDTVEVIMISKKVLK